MKNQSEMIKWGLIYQLWCVKPPFPFDVGEFERHASKTNNYFTVLTKHCIPRSIDEETGKDITDEMMKSKKVDENGYPYWTCQKDETWRHYVTNV